MALLRRLSNSDIRGSDQQARFLFHKIGVVEKAFAGIYIDVMGVARKSGRLRNKFDSLGRHLMLYAENETPGIRMSMSAVAEIMSQVQDFRQQEIERLEHKVLQPLKMYKTHCKTAKDELKTRESAKEKELSKQRALDKLQIKDPNNRAKISQAKLDLAGATTEVNHANKTLAENMERFEQKKIADIKMIMAEFIHTEMLFHARALEMYTKARAALEAINEHDDMQEMIMQMRPARMQQMPTAGMPGNGGYGDNGLEDSLASGMFGQGANMGASYGGGSVASGYGGYGGQGQQVQGLGGNDGYGRDRAMSFGQSGQMQPMQQSGHGQGIGYGGMGGVGHGNAGGFAGNSSLQSGSFSYGGGMGGGMGGQGVDPGASQALY
eukprot:Opistho-2@49847